MEVIDRIVVQPDLMLGQPCIRGSRLPVYVVIEAIAAGNSTEDVLSAYPFLTPEDISAALAYAARLAENGMEAV